MAPPPPIQGLAFQGGRPQADLPPLWGLVSDWRHQPISKLMRHSVDAQRHSFLCPSPQVKTLSALLPSLLPTPSPPAGGFLTRAKQRAALTVVPPRLAHPAAAADLLGDVAEGRERADTIPQHAEAGPLGLRDHVVRCGGQEAPTQEGSPRHASAPPSSLQRHVGELRGPASPSRPGLSTVTAMPGTNSRWQHLPGQTPLGWMGSRSPARKATGGAAGRGLQRHRPHEGQADTTQPPPHSAQGPRLCPGSTPPSSQMQLLREESRMKPSRHRQAKLPRVFVQAPLWQTPPSWHSSTSRGRKERSGRGESKPPPPASSHLAGPVGPPLPLNWFLPLRSMAIYCRKHQCSAFPFKLEHPSRGRKGLPWPPGAPWGKSVQPAHPPSLCLPHSPTQEPFCRRKPLGQAPSLLPAGLAPPVERAALGGLIALLLLLGPLRERDRCTRWQQDRGLPFLLGSISASTHYGAGSSVEGAKGQESANTPPPVHGTLVCQPY